MKPLARVKLTQRLAPVVEAAEIPEALVSFAPQPPPLSLALEFGRRTARGKATAQSSAALGPRSIKEAIITWLDQQL